MMMTMMMMMMMTPDQRNPRKASSESRKRRDWQFEKKRMMNVELSSREVYAPTKPRPVTLLESLRNLIQTFDS